MKEKTIAFEKWLINNYLEREDDLDYECYDCDGSGIVETTEGVNIGFNIESCVSCCGTGSNMHDEYEKQCEIDQERLRKFFILLTDRIMEKDK